MRLPFSFSPRALTEHLLPARKSFFNVKNLNNNYHTYDQTDQYALTRLDQELYNENLPPFADSVYSIADIFSFIKENIFCSPIFFGGVC